MDRGFAVEMENRFQGVDELAGRLKWVLEAIGKPIRTLAEVVAEQKVRLRRFDRKTQLIEHGVHTRELNNYILQRVQAIHTELVPYTLSAGGGTTNGLPAGIDKVADLLAVSVNIPGHSRTGQTFFLIGSRGDRCVLLRKTVTQEEGRPTEAGDCQQVRWYDPKKPPDAKALSDCVDDAAAIMVEKLTDRTVGNQR